MATTPEFKTIKPAASLKHTPIYPVDMRRLLNRAADGVDLTQALWPWYLAPWHEPDVSPETKAWVEGTYEVNDEEERRLLLTELAEAPTVRSIGINPIIQMPGGIASERGYQRSKGMKIISRVRGEPNDSNQPLEIRGPTLDDDPEFGSIGLKTVVAELERRQNWALKQLDAKIYSAEEMATAGDNTQKRYYRTVVSALKRAQRRFENGMPTVAELQRWFLEFERQRIRSRQSAQYLAEQAREQQISNLDQQIGEITSSIEAEWEQAGVTA